MNKKLLQILSHPKILRPLIIEFLIDQITNIFLISKDWYNAVVYVFNIQTNAIKKLFQQKYSKYFNIIQSSKFNLTTQLKFYSSNDTKKINIDLMLYLKLKQNSKFQKNNNYVISYSYQLKQDTILKNKSNLFHKENTNQTKIKRKKAKQYFWKLIFQYIGDQNEQKTVWMYKDQNITKAIDTLSQTQEDIKKKQQNIPYLMDCQPIRLNETICITLPYCIRNTIICPCQLLFYQMEQIVLLNSTYQKMFLSKQKNLCPLQNVYKWLPYDYFMNPISFQLDDAINCYKKQLQMQTIQINQQQDHFKIVFKCKHLLKPSKFMGHFLQILQQKIDKNKQVKVQLKKNGTYQQKNKNLILKVQDTLILYLKITPGQQI